MSFSTYAIGFVLRAICRGMAHHKKANLKSNISSSFCLRALSPSAFEYISLVDVRSDYACLNLEVVGNIHDVVKSSPRYESENHYAICLKISYVSKY